MNTAETTERNGAEAAVEDAFPVESFRDAAQHLRRPFTPQAVKFKVQATWDGGGLIVAYIDARLVIERLNLVCPHLWSDRYEPTQSGLMWCHLTVDGITRRDVGEGKGKALVSDALKRAAVHFGIGVSLYALPKIKLSVQDGHLRDTGQKDKKGKPILELTPNGESRCMSIYAAWLDALGRGKFGEPLDHGDAEDSVGDAEEFPGAQPKAEPVRAEAKRREGQGDGKSSQATANQRRKIHARASGLGLTELQLKAWVEWNAGTPHTDRIEKAAASKLIEMMEGYEDAADALQAFNTALEAEDEKAQRIAAKYSSSEGGES